MKVHSWKTIPLEALSESISRQVIHTAKMTVSHIHLKKGAVVARHSHSNEQISVVEQGRLRFEFDSGSQVVEAGEMLEIPPDEPHLVEALEDSVAMDLFAPVREDWVRGDDAYLRGR